MEPKSSENRIRKIIRPIQSTRLTSKTVDRTYKMQDYKKNFAFVRSDKFRKNTSIVFHVSNLSKIASRKESNPKTMKIVCIIFI